MPSKAVYASALAVFSTLVAAAPAPAANAVEIPPVWNETAWEIASGGSITKREDLPDFGDYRDDQTPSQFNDGDGTYIKSGDDKRYGAFGLSNHCWTDLFYVRSHIEADDWKRDDTSIDCGSTSSCESHRVQSGERCSSWNLAGTLSVELSRDQMSKILGIAGSASVTVGGEWGTCITSESDNVCIWDDKKCHSVYRSDLTYVHEGYIRRRCGLKHNDSTVWRHDVVIKQPIKETRIGCAATCDMTSYPQPVPPIPQ